MSKRSEIHSARLRTALELFAAGEAMMRANLRRRHPRANDEEIQSRLSAWLRTRPGAENGDSQGRLRRVP